jgi:hypothetical protein
MQQALRSLASPPSALCLGVPGGAAARLTMVATLRSAALATLLCLGTPAARADGCVVLLCLAAPSWRAIPQCVAPVRQVLRDLARGRPFPFCGMSGAGNSGQHAWAHAPDHCPPQYVQVVYQDGPPEYLCRFAGAVTVWINGEVFTRTWWAWDDDTVTEYSPAAKAQLGTWDTRFEDDHAAWLAAQPPAEPQLP